MLLLKSKCALTTDFRSGIELFQAETLFGSGGAGLEYLREKSSHKIWIQSSSFWFEDAFSLESCVQLSKIKSQGIPIMSNIYILEVFYFYFFSLTFFFFPPWSLILIIKIPFPIECVKIL